MRDDDRPCPYQVLGVDVGASERDVYTAFRRRSLVLHPDKAGAASAAAFHELVEAHAVLSDPSARRELDIEKMLDGVRFSRSSRRRPKTKSDDHDDHRGGAVSPLPLYVDPRTACSGGTLCVTLNEPASVVCPSCCGEGTTTREGGGGGGGTGRLGFLEECGRCRGTGTTHVPGEDRPHTFVVPPGVREGTGVLATTAGVPVEVRYSAHPVYGGDVRVDPSSGDVEVGRTIGVAQALCGGFRLEDVSDFSGDGRHVVDVPPGAYCPPGTLLRVRGGGLPPHGDLVIRVGVDWPSSSSAAAAGREDRRFRRRLRAYGDVLRQILSGMPGAAEKNI